MGTDSHHAGTGWRFWGLLLTLGALLACGGGGGSAPRPAGPSALAYASNPAVYTLCQSIPANQPTWSGGAITAFSVTPALPPGLALDAVSGVVAGTPSALRAVATHTITGTGPGGST